MDYSSIGMLALLVHIVINFDVWRKPDKDDIIPAHKSYRRFLFGVLLFYVADIFWGLLYENGLKTLCYIVTVLFFASMALSVFFWTKYITEYLEENKMFRNIVSTCGIVFLTFESLVLLGNVFYPMMFEFKSDGTYVTYSLRFITLIIQVVIFFVISAYILIVGRTKVDKERFRHRTIGVSGMVMAIFIILQAGYPLLPYYSAGCLLTTCVLHTFVLEGTKDDYRKELEILINKDKARTKELGSARLMAYTDSLTGLKNKHAYMEDRNKKNNKMAAGNLKNFALIVCDLNGLKKINDTLGHEAGDQYIRDAAAILNKYFKNCDIYRYGGDEFAVFIEGNNYANRNMMLIDFETAMEENALSGKMVLSSGMAVYSPKTTKHYKELFEEADKKMYQRKAYLKSLKK